VAELAVAGRPSVLVPLPSAIDDHQSANARALTDAEGAWLLPQAEATPEALAALLTRLFDAPDQLRAAAARAAAQGHADAAVALADLVTQHIHQESAA
jgi:UDP-N-acetylglucosamine--N-acetylmuramyl-(pentapeptide) pyrophosphoryl-undecaprenol N-acetylglucosamine transferase